MYTIKILFYLLFQGIEVLYDDANEEIESEKGPTDDKDDKIQIVEQRCFVLRLLINLGDIHCVLHDFLPPIESCLDVNNISVTRCRLRLD